MYRTPEGNLYPSVTTILSVIPKPELEKWKASVGEAEAARVSTRATRDGTIAHKAMEDYVDGADPDEFVFNTPRQLSTFESFRTAVDGHLTNVVGQELYLYGDDVQAAGATDLLGDWDGIPSIIDYKTSGRVVFPEEIEHYFVQLGMYAMMVHELYGEKRSQLVVVMAVNDDEEPLVMTRRVDAALAWRIAEIRESYKEKYGK